MLLTIVDDITDTDTIDVTTTTIAARLTALELTGDYLERLLTGMLAELDGSAA